MKRLAIYIFSTLFLFGCCKINSEDIEFNKADLRPFSNYKIGDTIFFASKFNDKDTIIIKKYEEEKFDKCGGIIQTKPSNSKWLTIKHLSSDKLYGYKSKDINNSNILETVSFLWVTKYPLDKRIKYRIRFKDFNSNNDSLIGILKTDTIILNDKKITNYYIVRHLYPERVTDSANIEFIYWTDEHGLTAYKNKGGLVWTKISYR